MKLTTVWVAWITVYALVVMPTRWRAWILGRPRALLLLGLTRTPPGRLVSRWAQARMVKRVHRRAWKKATRDACQNLIAVFGMKGASAEAVYAWGEHVVDCPLCRDVVVGHGTVSLMCPVGRPLFESAMAVGRRAALGNPEGMEEAATRAGIFEDRTVV